jgi:magnesium-transporting ATPase (P-type)
MDSFASLALATEPPTLALLDRPPYRRDEYIVSRKMVKMLLAMGIYEIFIVYAIVFAGEFFYPEPDMWWRFDRPENPYLYPGRVTDWDGSPLWSRFEKSVGSSRHMTNVFNVFVVM